MPKGFMDTLSIAMVLTSRSETKLDMHAINFKYSSKLLPVWAVEYKDCTHYAGCKSYFGKSLDCSYCPLNWIE